MERIRPPQLTEDQTPELTAPSYSAQVLRAAAEELDHDPRQILSEVRWHGTFALAVARTVARHPGPVADNAAELAWRAAPAGAAGCAHATYVGRLRAAADHADRETAELDAVRRSVDAQFPLIAALLADDHRGGENR